MKEADKARPARTTYRRWVPFASGAALVIIAIVAYLYFQRAEDGISSTAPAPFPSIVHDGSSQAETEAVDVQVTKPTRRDLMYRITLPANIAPLYQTTLYAKVSGYLKWIGPDKGDTVKKDQVLAVIDAPEVEEQYQQAVSDYKIKKLTHERLAKVWKESPDVIAKQDVDVAEAAYQGAKHSMEQREALRGYTKVRAPYDGTITARFADPGALIQVATASATGAIPLFTIMDLNTVRVYANVPQDESSWIVPGKTKATLILKDAADRSFSGTVTRSTLALDPSTRSLLIEIDLPNPDHVLRPGTFAEVAVGLREIPHALVLPPQAIISGTNGNPCSSSTKGEPSRFLSRRESPTGSRWRLHRDSRGTKKWWWWGNGNYSTVRPVQASPFNLPDAKPSSQKFERRTAGQIPPSDQALTTSQDRPGMPLPNQSSDPSR